MYLICSCQATIDFHSASYTKTHFAYNAPHKLPKRSCLFCGKRSVKPQNKRRSGGRLPGKSRPYERRSPQIRT